MKFKRCLLFTACLMGMVCFLSSTLMVGQTDPSWRLWYPQVVNGVIGNNTYVTSLIVSNPSNIGIEVALEDFDHNSPDQWLRTSYTSNCKVVGTHFFLPAFATCRLDTDGVGPYESGWLRISEVTKSNNLGGYLSYTYYQGALPDDERALRSPGLAVDHVEGERQRWDSARRRRRSNRQRHWDG